RARLALPDRPVDVLTLVADEVDLVPVPRTGPVDAAVATGQGHHVGRRTGRSTKRVELDEPRPENLALVTLVDAPRYVRRLVDAAARSHVRVADQLGRAGVVRGVAPGDGDPVVDCVHGNEVEHQQTTQTGNRDPASSTEDPSTQGSGRTPTREQKC